MEAEVWKPIPEYPGYEISNLGRVKSLPKTWRSGRKLAKVQTKPETILKLFKSRGATQVGLPGGKRLNVARAVASAFIPNPDQRPYVDHIDGNISNNSSDNLRWATNQENQMNRGLMATNTSGYPNIVRTRGGRWRARVVVDGKKVGLGTFDLPEDAANAAFRFKQEKYGQYVRPLGRPLGT